MRRPLAPMMSVITEHSLMFASSRTAWMRCTCCTISRVNCFRCVHPALSSHSASANNPCVVVGKRRTFSSTLRLLIRRRQATTSTLCTSRPAHRLCNVFIATSLGRGRREALAHRILPTVFQDLGSQLGQPHPLTTITGARRASGQTHSRARSHQATPTSVPAAPHPSPFHPSGCEGAHANYLETESEVSCGSPDFDLI